MSEHPILFSAAEVRAILAGLAAIYGWEDAGLYASGHPNAWCKTLLLREARKLPHPTEDHRIWCARYDAAKAKGKA